MVCERIEIPIFNSVVVLFKGSPYSLKKKIEEDWFEDDEADQEAFSEVFKSFKESYDTGNASAWTTYYGGIAYCLFPANSDDLTYSTLVHELSHAVTFLMQDREIQDNTDECRSYILGYIFEKSYKFRKKAKFIDK